MQIFASYRISIGAEQTPVHSGVGTEKEQVR